MLLGFIEQFLWQPRSRTTSRQLKKKDDRKKPQTKKPPTHKSLIRIKFIDEFIEIVHELIN